MKLSTMIVLALGALLAGTAGTATVRRRRPTLVERCDALARELDSRLAARRPA